MICILIFQVAWEGLIDALIFPKKLPCKKNGMKEDEGTEQMGTYKCENNEIQENGFSKSIKLIMTPLIRIISSNCDASVRSSCFNTWCYLLHKLDSSVNSPSARKLVLQPFFEAVFQGLDSESIWLWNLCIDLLDDSILAKCFDVDYDSSNLVSQSTRTSMHGPFTSGKYSWKLYPIKWLSWDLSQLDFHLKIICILIHQASKKTVHQENRLSAYDASLRLFRSVSKGVQLELKKLSTNYDDVTLCLNTILKFIKDLYEEKFEGSVRNDLQHICLKFVEVVSEEIEPAILGSPLYKVALDLKYIESLHIVKDIEHAKDLDMCFITYMDLVSPMVYLTALYFCLMVQSTMNMPETEFIPQAIQRYFKLMLSSYDPMENFVVTIGLLYKHTWPSCLRMWIAISEGLKDYVFDKMDVSLFKMEYNSSYFATCHLLSYPFFICYCHQKGSMLENVSSDCAKESYVTLKTKLDLEQVLEVWKQLYSSVCTPRFEYSSTNNFSEDLLNLLGGWLDKYSSMLECANDLELNHKDWDLDVISLYGGIVMYVLEQSQSSELSSDEKSKHCSGEKLPGGVISCMTLVIR